MSLIIKEMKIAEKKSKSRKMSAQQTTDGAQPTKSAANRHRVCDAICNAMWKKTMDFLDLQTKTSDQLFRGNLTSRACESRAGQIHCLANRDQGTKHWALRPQKPLLGGRECLYLTPTRYTVTTRMILH